MLDFYTHFYKNYKQRKNLLETAGFSQYISTGAPYKALNPMDVEAVSFIIYSKLALGILCHKIIKFLPN